MWPSSPFCSEGVRQFIESAECEGGRLSSESRRNCGELTALSARAAVAPSAPDFEREEPRREALTVVVAHADADSPDLRTQRE